MGRQTASSGSLAQGFAEDDEFQDDVNMGPNGTSTALVRSREEPAPLRSTPPQQGYAGGSSMTRPHTSSAVDVWGMPQTQTYPQFYESPRTDMKKLRGMMKHSGGSGMQFPFNSQTSSQSGVQNQGGRSTSGPPVVDPLGRRIAGLVREPVQPITMKGGEWKQRLLIIKERKFSVWKEAKTVGRSICET